MANLPQSETKNKKARLQAILQLIEERSINRQEELLEHLKQKGFAVTQATVSRDIRELSLVKASTEQGYRYISARPEQMKNAHNTGRFQTIFRESVIKVDYAGHTVVVKCYTGMANAACGVFDSLGWNNVVGTLSGDDTFFILARTERDAKIICNELIPFIGQA
ncbi:MAG: arginine repressor [Faecalibacterium sp.]